MKKSSFVTMMLATISGVFFALGMCMALLPEWNAFKPGVVFGIVGIVSGVVTFIAWRKMEHKAPIHLNGRIIAISVLGIFGALLLGVGMCFCMVWENVIFGIVIGLIGIFLLLTIVPITKGIK